jgi:hypothetical protein
MPDLGPNFGPKLTDTTSDPAGLLGTPPSAEANKFTRFETSYDGKGLAYAISKTGVSWLVLQSDRVSIFRDQVMLPIVFLVRRII